jgi:hypothetical protein
MDFVEEKTPSGIALKILLNRWHFLAFDKKGKTIYADADGRTQLHKVPLIIFLGKNISARNPFSLEYTLAKIRKKNIIIQYKDRRDNRIKYLFIPTDKKIDMIPVKIFPVDSIVSLVREVDKKLEPDYIVVDSTQSENDYVIIKSKLKTAEIIKIDSQNNYYIINSKRTENDHDEYEKSINLNMMSNNPVYLARVHLASMELSKVNQLLLDFDLNALDSEYIFTFISNILKNTDDPLVIKNQPMLQHLRDAFIFYMLLLQKKDDAVKEMIGRITSTREFAPYMTLIQKAKSIFPGREDQILYTDYENMLFNRKDELES